ncbi:MAG TPA: hypothetical protein VH413_04325 [Verrucomicrobiae bacterium]|nr:hypothetical protein [Verrucomicrobiae bacterium]
MNKRRAQRHPHARLIVLLFVLCLLSAITFAIRYEAEPSFEAYTLTEWVQKMDLPQQEEYSRAVVRQLGTNHIPMLLSWVRKSANQKPVTSFDRVKSAAIDWLRTHHVFSDDNSSERLNRRETAEKAFAEFDPASKKIVVQSLVEMLKDEHHPKDAPSGIQEVAYEALPYLAPEAIPPLLAVLTNDDAFAAAVAARTLSKMETNAQVIIPLLEQQLIRTNTFFRTMIVISLSDLNDDPEHYMPQFVQILPHMDPEFFPFSMAFLDTHKAQASNAVPVLLEMLRTMPNPNDPTNRPRRIMIIHTLHTLAPNLNVTAAVK